jgi:FHS family glucose/mannose:H+ symporter-like MFS transporter
MEQRRSVVPSEKAREDYSLGLAQRLIWTRLAWASLGYYAWASVLAGALLPQLSETFGFSDSLSGLLLAIPSVGFSLAGIVGGWLSERISLQRLLSLSAVGLMISLVLAGSSSFAIMIIVATMLIGFSGGVMEVGANGLIVSIYHDRAASQLNLLHVFYSSGAFLSPLVVAIIVTNNYSWRVNYILASILTLIFAFILNRQSAPLKLDIQSTSLRKVLHLVTRQAVARAWISAVFFTAGEFGLSYWLTTYFQRVLGFSPGIASGSLSVFWIAMLIGRIINSRLPSSTNLSPIIISELVGCVFSVLLVFGGGNFKLIVIGVLFSGFFMAGLIPNLLAYASHDTEESIGSISGLILSGAGVGMLIGPGLIGILADVWDLKTSMYTALFLLLVVLVIFSLPSRRKTYSR